MKFNKQHKRSKYRKSKQYEEIIKIIALAEASTLAVVQSQVNVQRLGAATAQRRGQAPPELKGYQ